MSVCQCGCGVDSTALAARIERLLIERMPQPEHLRPVDAILDRVESRLGSLALRAAVRFVGRRSR